MQSKVSAVWLKTTNAFVLSNVGRWLARLWHKVMPSFPVRRRVFDFHIYYDSRDNPWVWYSDRGALEQGDNFADTLARFRGVFWDLGTNVGIYALRAASLGYTRVVAFDISPKCISYVIKSARKNGFANVVGVARAISVETITYQPPATGAANNSLAIADRAGTVKSITYLEAAAEYGIPNLIKMDIEAHEEAFLRSMEFKNWIVTNKVALVVELHKKEFWDLLWTDVPNTRLSENLVLIRPPGAQP